MINAKFKEVFDLSNELQIKTCRKVYDGLSKDDKKLIGIFEEFLEQEKKDTEREITPEKRKKIDDAYILKDIIKKDNLVFDLYLIHLKHIDPIEFDENYKPLPLNEKDIYEYGAVVSLDDNSGHYNISGIFGGADTDEHFARDKYNVIKNKISNSSENELLDELKNDILNQINE